jgi:hypothetical protein
VLVLGFLIDTPSSDDAVFVDLPHEPVLAPDRVGSTRFSDHYEVS